MSNATNTQIANLMTEAAEAGDTAQVELCEAALSGDAAARAKCTAVIMAAQANDDDELTAEERHGTWTIVDTSGQRFWPAPAANSARAALAAAHAGRGTWRQ